MYRYKTIDLITKAFNNATFDSHNKTYFICQYRTSGCNVTINRIFVLKASHHVDDKKQTPHKKKSFKPQTRQTFLNPIGYKRNQIRIKNVNIFKY